MSSLRLRLVYLVLLLSALAPATLVSGQDNSTFQVDGYLSGADFLITYSFNTTSQFLFYGGPDATPSALYRVLELSGSRTFTNRTTGATQIANLSLLAPYYYAGNDDLMWPYSTSATYSSGTTHALFDLAGIDFSVSASDVPIGAVINLFWDTNRAVAQYSESSDFETELTILDSFFTTTASGVPEYSSTGSTSPPSEPPPEFNVTGELAGVDFLVTYSFHVVTAYLSTSFVPDPAFLVVDMYGTRTFSNTTTGESVVANLTLLPAGGLGGNYNVLYPYSSNPTFSNSQRHTLFDYNGLDFNLSSPEEVVGYGPLYSAINLFWDTTLFIPQYSEEGAGSSHEHSITAAYFTTDGLPITLSSTGGPLPPPFSSGPTAPPTPPPGSELYSVTGFLVGDDYIISYAFTGLASYITGTGASGTPNAAYSLFSGLGMRNYTNVTTGVTEEATIFLLSPNTLGANDNVLFPYSPTEVFDPSYNNHSLVDSDGLTFGLSTPEQFVGVTGYTSVINLYWNFGNPNEAAHYTEEGVFSFNSTLANQTISASYFSAVITHHPATSSSSISAPPPVLSSSSSSAGSTGPVSGQIFTFHVSGSLTGNDYSVGYEFDCVTSYQTGEIGNSEAVFHIISATGQRSFLNTTTEVIQLSVITLLPTGAYDGNSNTLYPYSSIPSGFHGLIDAGGLSWNLTTPEEIAYYGNCSLLNLYYTGGVPQYTEDGGCDSFGTEQGIVSAEFAAVDTTPSSFSSSSTGSALPPPLSSSSSSSTAPVSVLGDPQFVGLRGQSFQVHGIDGEVYSLIVDRVPLDGSVGGDGGVSARTATTPAYGLELVNSRFVFLTGGRCPPTTAITTACWSHPGSYLGEVGVVSAGGGARLRVVSGAWDVGFSRVELNGAVLSIGSAVLVDGITVHVTSAYELSLSIHSFDLTLHNSDRFVNVAKAEVHSWSELSSHGLLGQTWRATSDNKHPIEGTVDDYAETNSDLLGSGFVYGVAAQD